MTDERDEYGETAKLPTGPTVKLRSLNWYVQKVYYEHAGTMPPVWFTRIDIGNGDHRMAGFRLRVRGLMLGVFWK